MGRAEQTRRELQEAAVRLFAARGYDNVTVEEIATAVGVSHMTFFRHFPTKVSVLVDDPYDPVIGEMVAATDASLPPLERVTQGILESWAHVDEPDDDAIRTRFRLLTQHEDLVAAVWSNNRKTEQVIIDALTSTAVPLLDARVAAGAVMGALMAALIDWGEHENSGTLGDRVRFALEMLGGSDA
ncbi:MAG: TetR/AcrR family transcriptional regulator [Acidimicrobiia bacterium]